MWKLTCNTYEWWIEIIIQLRLFIFLISHFLPFAVPWSTIIGQWWEVMIQVKITFLVIVQLRQSCFYKFMIRNGCNSARESDIFRCPQSFLLSKKAKTNVKIILFNSIPISVGHVNLKWTGNSSLVMHNLCLYPEYLKTFSSL